MYDFINYPGSVVDPTGQKHKSTALIDADSIIYIVGWQYKDSDDAAKVADVVDQFIADIMIVTQSTQFAGFFSSKKTTRHEIYPAYKETRREIDPGIAKWKPFILEYCQEYWGFYTTPNAEADDAVAVLQNNMVNTVICSPDKDLKQIPGRHYDYKKGLQAYVSPEEGKYNWAVQMITGDTTDNIKGVPGAGPAAAKKLLGIGPGIVDSDMYEDIVKSVYNNKFGNLDEYILHTKLIGMGDEKPEQYIHALNTYDLANATPSEYLRQRKEMDEALNVYGVR